MDVKLEIFNFLCQIINCSFQMNEYKTIDDFNKNNRLGTRTLYNLHFLYSTKNKKFFELHEFYVLRTGVGTSSGKDRQKSTKI